jgi:hypothetical protein
MILALTDLINDIEDGNVEIEPLNPLYSQLHHTRKCCMDLVDTLEELEVDGED